MTRRADDAAMNWPPPLDELHDDPQLLDGHASTQPDPPRPIAATDDRRRTARPLAAWLAIVGAALVMLAAIVVVAGQWQALSAEFRCALLMAGVAIVFVVAEHLRPATPVTAMVIGHLAPLLVAPAAVAAGATLHQSWRVCILAAGLATVPFAEVQRRRWPLPLLIGGTAAAMSLAAAGAAALAHVPVAVLAGAAALALMAGGARRHALTLAALTAAGPVLAVLAEMKLGAGTLAELGASGSTLAWAAPIAGLLAATVMGVEAQRRNSVRWAGASLASALVGVLTGLAGGATPVTAWCLLPAALLIVLELMDLTPADGPWRPFSAPLTWVRVAVPSAALPFGALALLWPTTPIGREWLLPSGLTAAASALTVARTARRTPEVADPVALSTIVTGVASLRLLDVPAAWGAAALCIVAVAVWVRRAAAPIVAGGTAVLSMVMLALEGGTFDWHNALLVVGIAVAGAALAGTLPRAALNDPIASGLLLAVPTLAAEVAVADRVGGMAALVVAATVVTVRVPQRAEQLAIGAAVVSLLGLATPVTAAISIAAGAAATFGWCRRSPLRHLGSAQTVVAVVVGCHAAGASQMYVAAGLLLAAVALTGVAFTTGRVTVLDSLAIAASPTALALSLAHHRLSSVAVIVIGAQLLLYGTVRRQLPMRAAGALVITGGALSLWWTTGANAWAVRSLAPLGVREGDLITLFLGLCLLGLGAVALRWSVVRSYVAVGPGLVVVSEALLLGQLRPDGEWAAVAALALGIVWVGVGAWRRLGAYLVGGTVLLAATVSISSGERLAALPGWVWMLVGGSALVALATAVERGANGQHGGVRDLVRRLR